MIKLVSFFVFTAAFVWTWFLFNSHDKISQATHAGLQSKLMILIEESIKAARPNASDFEILNIYTQKIDDNQVSAHFTYKFKDSFTNQLEEQEQEQVNQTLSGEAVLYRMLSENPLKDKWITKSFKTNNSSIEFQQGLTVNLDAAEDSTIAPTVAPVTEEKKTH